MDESRIKRDLEQRVEIMEKTLVGDLASQRAGLMQNMLKLMEDVYDQDNGIKPRMEKVERSRAMQSAYVAGAVAAIVVVWKVGEKIVETLVK